jgi:hypothetical protein
VAGPEKRLTAAPTAAAAAADWLLQQANKAHDLLAEGDVGAQHQGHLLPAEQQEIHAVPDN